MIGQLVWPNKALHGDAVNRARERGRSARKKRGQVLIRALCACVRLRRWIVWSFSYEAWPVMARASVGEKIGE